MLLYLYKIYMEMALDLLTYECFELLDIGKTTHKLTTTQTHPFSAPAAPPSPPNHWINISTCGFLEAIPLDDVPKPTPLYKLCIQLITKDFDAFKFDHS